MAELWTLQDTSIITGATPKQRTQPIKKCDKSTLNNSRLKVLSELTYFNLFT